MRRLKIRYPHSQRILRGILILMSSGSCALSMAQTLPAPSRDQRAIDVMSSCLRKSVGTDALATIQDLTASGNITYFWGDQEVEGNATILARGPDQFRLNATLPEGKSTWIVNRGQVTLTKADGTVRKSTTNNALVTGAVTFPEAKVALFLADPRVGLQYGLSTLDGVAVYHIRAQIQPPASTNPRSSTASNRPGLLDMFYEVNTCHLIKTQDVFYPTTNVQDSYPHELFFGDFRQSQGHLMPYAIIERFAGQTTWMLRLQSVTLNTGVPNSEFQTEP